MSSRRILLATVGTAALAAALSPGAWAGNGTSGLRASAMPPQNLAITIRPVVGTVHGEHVTIPTFAVAPGLAVRITFTNYTHQAHTFTAPGLGVSAFIRAAHGKGPATTVVTFTAHKHGVFGWTCHMCPDGQSGDTTMKGKIYAIVQV